MRSGVLCCLVVVFGVLSGRTAIGQTLVGGLIDVDTTWTLAESPYLATETVELIGGAVLTIEPGVEVAFERDQGLDTRRGVLIADGLGGEAIVFRSIDGEVGAWPGIVTSFDVPAVATPDGEYVSGPLLRNVRILDAVEAVVTISQSVYFEGVVIERCLDVGFSFRDSGDSTLWFKGVTVRDAGLGIDISAASRVMLLDCLFEDNARGGVQIRNADGGTLARSVFRRNGWMFAALGGGGASLWGNWTIQECVFEHNEAIETLGRGGGGLYLFTTNSTISDCEFLSNTSRQAGGGAEVRPSSEVAEVRIERCRFIGNESQTTSGGGLLAGGGGFPQLQAEIIDCHFEANHGDKNGGLAVGAALGEVRGCTFLGNTARTSAGGLRIYDDVRDLVIRGNAFLGNSTEAAGGGIDMTNTRSAVGLEITANTFEGNTADRGGAIGGIAGRTVAVAGNRFVANTARLGGAVHVRENFEAVTLAAKDGLVNRFADNLADLGSDIYNDSDDAIDATGNCWGTTDPAAIAERIYDAADDPTKGVVAFDPIATDCDACPADLDGDGALTIFDFLMFQNLFDAGDPRADFDGDGELTIFDFLAFQSAFDAGCP